MRERKSKQKVFKPGSIVRFRSSSYCSCVVKILSTVKDNDYAIIECLLYSRGPTGTFNHGCRGVRTHSGCGRNSWEVSPSCYELLKLFIEKDTGDKEKE